MEELLKKLDREKGSHKGDNGKVAVIAGSKDYTGAPAIVARAAYRSGADLVKILTSEEVVDTVAAFSENLIVSSYSGDYFTEEDINKAEDLISWSDTAVIGPGLSSSDDKAVREIVESSETPLVIDADAIKPAVKADIRKAVFTPHQNEKRHIEEHRGSVKKFASESRVVTVKGNTDKIYSNEELHKNNTGCESMTVGGTGDMLTGVIASLSAQGLNITEAAHLGVFANGKAGEEAANEYGQGALPTDMIECLPRLLFE